MSSELDRRSFADDQRMHDRAFVILKAAVSVTVDVAADPALRPRGSVIAGELARMIDAYLTADAWRTRQVDRLTLRY
jgi:hypothetical protein